MEEMLMKRKHSWLQNKQEKWKEIYAIRVFHSNPARCISLHPLGLDGKKTDSTNSSQYWFCVYIISSPFVRKIESKVSQGNNKSRSMLMLIALFDGDSIVICGWKIHSGMKESFRYNEMVWVTERPKEKVLRSISLTFKLFK